MKPPDRQDIKQILEDGSNEKYGKGKSQVSKRQHILGNAKDTEDSYVDSLTYLIEEFKVKIHSKRNFDLSSTKSFILIRLRILLNIKTIGLSFIKIQDPLLRRPDILPQDDVMILFSNTEEILDEHKNFKEKLDNATHMLEIDMNYSLGNLFIQMVKFNYYLSVKILEKVASPEILCLRLLNVTT